MSELETKAHSAFLPSINKLRDGLDTETAVLVSKYLEDGVDVVDAMEATQDPYDKKIYIPGGSSLKSDGYWVWRKDLSYFVKMYRISLPQDFIEHVLSKKRIPIDEHDVLSRSQEITESYRSSLLGG